jgi:hypothetical protein
MSTAAEISADATVRVILRLMTDRISHPPSRAGLRGTPPKLRYA